MTAAQVQEAARLLALAHVPDQRVVTFIELGSEGCKLAVREPGGAIGVWEREWLIARDGVFADVTRTRRPLGPSTRGTVSRCVPPPSGGVGA